MQWLELPVPEYRDPNAEAGDETGADVLVILASAIVSVYKSP
jgi:hypothetical protein